MRTGVAIRTRTSSISKSPSPSTLVALMAIAFAVVGAFAPGSTTAADPLPKRILFDGKTLEGWKKTDFAHSGPVKVEQGQIILSAGNSMTGITSTRNDLPRINYELTYSAMRVEGVDFFAAATFPVAGSYLTFVNGGWGGHVTGLSSLNGQDASENETGRPIKFENGKWYAFRIRVTDRAVRCWIDEKPIVALDYRDHQLGTRIETRSSQPLGFATWETSGALKAIEIRPLTPAEVAEANHFE
jgi:3-keto-disaccharide hydrolase